MLVDAEVICACMCRCHLCASVEVTRVSELGVLAEVTHACMQRSRARGVLYACTQGSVARSGRSKSCECSLKSLTQVQHVDVSCMCTLKSIVHAHISHLGVHTEIKRARTPMITRTRPIRTLVHVHVHIICIHELPTLVVGQQL